jgi:hypothetical protein
MCPLLLTLLCATGPVFGETFRRDLQVDVTVNQIGFAPEASKKCVLKAPGPERFEVIRTNDQKVVFSGPLVASNGDFGGFLVGDFSSVKEVDTYYIKAGQSRSYPLRISREVYGDAIGTIVGYFALQRCGPSETGYLAPCHCDDAVRLDNGKHQDTTGGWHDASDLRKWVGATIHGMIGLAQVYDLTPDESMRRRILEELRWGNRYFLNMQEPAGYVMSHVGGDALRHGDENRWTDNLVGPEGGEPNTIDPAPGGSTSKITIVGHKDDRVIQTRPLDRLGQYKFVIAEAMTARLAKPSDPPYSDKCLQAAQRCYDWCATRWPEQAADTLGGALSAAVELYRSTGQEKFKKEAIAAAARLAPLQVTEPLDAKEPVRGFYRRTASSPELYRDISNGCWYLLGLCGLVELFPDHAEADNWRKAIRLYTVDYLAAVSKRNSFGLVPYGFFAQADPGGNRKIGSYWYRYFMPPGSNWWVGVNANIASAGVGLVRASKILHDPSLRSVAQSQLDWILGGNPFYAAPWWGIGYNHPPAFVNGGEFKPATPRLPGAVMNGLGGTADDQPFIGDGIYNVSEWLMALLQQS